MRSLCIRFPGPVPVLINESPYGQKQENGGGETAGVEHRAMHMKNKPLSDPNCSPRVSHSWANLYVPAPPGFRSAGETGNDGPPVARPGGAPLTTALGKKLDKRHRGERHMCD